jgi:hypothetical protein
MAVVHRPLVEKHREQTITGGFSHHQHCHHNTNDGGGSRNNDNNRIIKRKM